MKIVHRSRHAWNKIYRGSVFFSFQVGPQPKLERDSLRLTRWAKIKEKTLAALRLERPQIFSSLSQVLRHEFARELLRAACARNLYRDTFVYEVAWV